jgi:hypothetical protein
LTCSVICLKMGVFSLSPTLIEKSCINCIGTSITG